MRRTPHCPFGVIAAALNDRGRAAALMCKGSRCALWRPDPEAAGRGGCGLTPAAQTFADPNPDETPNPNPNPNP